ncbi:hypothetical protein MASR1M8_16010 [Thermomonas brevis]
MAVELARRGGRVSPVHNCHTPRVLCIVTIPDITSAAKAIARRINATYRDRRCGSYLFVDGSGRAFVVSEEASVAQTWCREKFSWLVGLYSPGIMGQTLEPTIAGVTEDLAYHLGVHP